VGSPGNDHPAGRWQRQLAGCRADCPLSPRTVTECFRPFVNSAGSPLGPCAEFSGRRSNHRHGYAETKGQRVAAAVQLSLPAARRMIVSGSPPHARDNRARRIGRRRTGGKSSEPAASPEILRCLDFDPSRPLRTTIGRGSNHQEALAAGTEAQNASSGAPGHSLTPPGPRFTSQPKP